MTKIVIPTKKTISIKNIYAHPIFIAGRDYIRSTTIVDAVNTSLSRSQYFNIQSDANFQLDINIKNKKGMNGLGFLFYFLTLATVPVPITDDDIVATCKIYNLDGRVIKEYNFKETSHSMLTVFSPFAVLAGASSPNISKALADKVVSNLIYNLEKDDVLIYSDSNRI